ncbi:D-sedoheptulose-7-phosphate isomerase (plasmid) [Rhizobium leguminosarum]
MQYSEITDYITTFNSTLASVEFATIASFVDLIDRAWREDRQIIVCGNGGSALTALHYVTDWNKSLPLATGRRFRGRSLLDNIGLLTAHANDQSYPESFAEQIRNLTDPGDVVLFISGSGNSANVIEGAKAAKALGATVASIVGFDGGKLPAISDHVLHVSRSDMQICEDIHMMVGHIILRALMKRHAKPLAAA